MFWTNRIYIYISCHRVEVGVPNQYLQIHSNSAVKYLRDIIEQARSVDLNIYDLN